MADLFLKYDVMSRMTYAVHSPCMYHVKGYEKGNNAKESLVTVCNLTRLLSSLQSTCCSGIVCIEVNTATFITIETSDLLVLQ